LGAWTIAPALTLGYERVLANPRVESIGTIYGYSVSQYSFYDSRDLTKAGLGITAQRGSFLIKAGIDGLMGGAVERTGINGWTAISHDF